MGRELQKRKRRSSRAKVTMPNRRKKALNPLGNDIIAQAWFVLPSLSPLPTNLPTYHTLPSSLHKPPIHPSILTQYPPPNHRNKKETLSQNYTRFGLVAKLGKTTGGTAPSNRSNLNTATDPLAAQSSEQGLLRVVQEVKVERDASGRITRVVRDTNPLNDPLNELDPDSDAEAQQAREQEQQRRYEAWSGFQEGEGGERPEVLRALEREANQPTEKTVRHQSGREVEWLQRLVARHGDDTAAMVRDVKLNPMQQTAADIRRRLKKAGLLEA
jgi:nucleolar protein 16